MSELAYLTLSQAANLLRNRKLSPVEYVEGLFRRIRDLDPRLNAFIRLTEDEAMRTARQAEAEIAAGRWRGPLHGVPYGLKDIIDAAGHPSTAHSKILLDNVAKGDATVTGKLRAAGGVLMGKLSTHEFALGGPSFDLPFPPARNPWNPDHHPGGSSSGAGAALAAGFLPAALGTDTGGSVRNPASMCGIVGMKATYGRVSRAGVIPLSFSLDHVGPMTRTVEDNALLLNVIAGYDPADTASARVPALDFAKDLKRGVKGLKIGIVRHFHIRDLPAEADMTQSIEDAGKLLTELGAELREISLPPLGDYSDCNRTILFAEAYAIHERWLQERPEDYGALTRERLLAGAFMRAVDYVQALRTRAMLTRETNAAMAAVDALICASSMQVACRIDDPAAVAATYARQARTPFNLTGLPAMSVPTGFSQAGLPLAMQIVGKPFDEAGIYRVAYAYEQASAWTSRHPALD